MAGSHAAGVLLGLKGQKHFAAFGALKGLQMAGLKLKGESMHYLYVTDCAENGGIYRFLLKNGQPVFKEKTELNLPMYTVLKNNTAYVLLRGAPGQNGSLTTAPIKPNGSLGVFSAPVSTKGQVPCHLCVSKGQVYVVNYLSGNVVQMPNTVVTHSGHGVHPTRQTAAHTHFVFPSPDEQYILCVDLGLDTIFVYTRELQLVSTAAVPPGSGCRHFVFSQNGRWLYCVNELSSNISVFFYQNGMLTYQTTYNAFRQSVLNSTAAAIRLNGNYLYISHRGQDCISRFAVENEKLHFLENTPCGGHAPRDFNILGDYLYCANESGSLGILDLTGTSPSLCDSIPLGQDLLGINFYEGESNER